MPLRGTHACFAWVPLGGDGRQCGVSVGSVLALRPSCGVQRGSMGLWVWLGGTGRLPLRVTHACSAWVRRGRVGDSVMSVWGQCWHRDACVGAVGSMGPLVFFWGGGEDDAIAGDPRVFCVGSAWGGGSVGSVWGQCWHRDACVGAVGLYGAIGLFGGRGGEDGAIAGYPRVFCVGSAWGWVTMWGRCGVSAGMATPVGAQRGSMGPLGSLGAGGGGHDVPLRGTHACFAWAQPAGAAGSQWGQR